jgi:hypothetical protein
MLFKEMHTITPDFFSPGILGLSTVEVFASHFKPGPNNPQAQVCPNKGRK